MRTLAQQRQIQKAKEESKNSEVVLKLNRRGSREILVFEHGQLTSYKRKSAHGNSILITREEQQGIRETAEPLEALLVHRKPINPRA